MPREPDSYEKEALERSSGLLKFAAQQTTLPIAEVSSITSALDAYKANTWDGAQAAAFWPAYATICNLIKPVTIDTISTNDYTINVPSWQFWRKKKLSLSGISAGRHMCLLIILLFLSVVLGFYISTSRKLADEIVKLIESTEKIVDKISADTDSIRPVIKTPFSEAPPEQQKILSSIQKNFKSVDDALDQIIQRKCTMMRLVYLGAECNYSRGNRLPAAGIQDIDAQSQAYYLTRQDVLEQVLIASTTVDAVSSLLAIVLGTMGACAYVVRMISEQIKNATFSPTSPTRHVVRVVLGGLAGVIIGYGGITTLGGLSSSAIAFLAGYAIEPVFATLDAVAAKFK